MKRNEAKRLMYWIDLMKKEDVDKFQPLYAKYAGDRRPIDNREDQAVVMQHGIEMIVLAKLLHDELETIQFQRPLWKKIFNL